MSVADIIRKLGVSEQTFYRRKQSTGAWALPNHFASAGCVDDEGDLISAWLAHSSEATRLVVRRMN